MKRLPVLEEDRRSIADWYARWGDLVADVNFKAARPMFAEDAVAFGSKVEMMTSQAQLEREQWRAVWPSIEDYRYDLATLEVVTSPDRLMAMGAVIFRSTGLHLDGKKFERNGRATCALMRDAVGSPWICTHSHISLKPGTPVMSHRNRRSVSEYCPKQPTQLEIPVPVMSGKRAFLDLLKQEGVRVMFGNPGTTELPLMDAFAVENDIRYILGLQEAALMAMADGYAQASGELAVLNLHVAPGLGNAMGMLYDAMKANAPVLITAGQQDLEYLATEPVLSADLPTLARPFVKWAAEVHRVEDLPLYVHRAVKTALAPPTGPVFLSLPGDMLKNDADIDLLEPTRIAPRVRGDAEAVAAAAALLAKAERPVIIAGDAVMQSRAHAELAALAEALGAPVYCEFVPNTASFPSSHPLYRGSMTRSQPGVREVLDKHDLLFSVGGDLFTWSLPSNVNPWPAGLPLIHLDTDPWQIGKNYPAQVGILGDPKATLPDITKALGERMSAAQKSAVAARLKSASETIKADREAFRAKARALAGKTPVQPLALLEAIGAMLPKDAVVIEEVLSSAPGARSLINSNDPQSFFALRGGGIGWGLPAAIGVKLAVPDRPVVALVGDGSAMYTVQGLWTAAHYKLPIVWVIFNNTSYRILKQRLVNMRGLAEQADNFVGMNLTDPAIDFVGLARSLGIEGQRAKTVKDATDLIGKALKDGIAMLIDVDMDRNYKPM